MNFLALISAAGMFGAGDGFLYQLPDINQRTLKMKRGKVGTRGKEIAAALYGSKGRPLNPVEATRHEDNMALAHAGKIARGEIGVCHYTPTFPAAVERTQTAIKDKTKRSSKWTAARRANGLRDDGTKA